MCPTIGDNVELMIVSRVLGNIHIANNVRIGAKTLVIKNINAVNTTWAGIPAKKISDKGTIRTPIPRPPHIYKPRKALFTNSDGHSNDCHWSSGLPSSDFLEAVVRWKSGTNTHCQTSRIIIRSHRRQRRRRRSRSPSQPICRYGS